MYNYELFSFFLPGLNNPKLLDVIGDLLDKKQLKDLSIIGCETEDGVFRRALQCLHNSYRLVIVPLT